jgi:PAS domain S-box-containing protein
MLIRSKLLLSAVIGVGSVIALILIVFYHYRQEQFRGDQMMFLSGIEDVFARIDRDLYHFVVSPDSTAAQMVRGSMSELREKVSLHSESLHGEELFDVTENMIDAFSRYEQLRLNPGLAEYPEQAVETFYQIREMLIESRFIIQQESEALAVGVYEAEETQSRLITFFILPALLVAVTLIFLTSRELIGKMNRLLIDTGRIEKGEFSHRVEVAGRDEFGRISEAVNRVTDALNQARMKEQSYRQDMLRRTDQVNLLQELALVANRIHNVNELYRLVVERLRSYTGWVSAHVFVQSRDGKSMVPSGIWSYREKEVVAGFMDETSQLEFEKGEGLIGGVFETGETGWIEDANDTSGFVRQLSASEAGIRTIAAFPVVVEGEVHAVIELHCQKRISSDPDLTELFRGVGALISHVITREQYVNTLNMQTEHLNYALDSAGMYSWSIDLETGHYQLSRNFRRILGLNAGRTGSVEEFQSFIHPDDVEAANEKFRKLIDDYQGYSSEFRFIGDDGKERHVWSKGDVIHDLEGRPQKVAGIVMDITERKLIESLLEASELNYRLMFENSPLPLWIFTRESNRVVDANAMMEKMFGYTKEELRRQFIKQLLHEETIEVFDENIGPGSGAGPGSIQSFTDFEARLRTARGTWLDVQIYAASIAYMEEPCVIATCIDITELKQTRKRLLGSIIEGEDRERQRVAIELHDGIGQYLTATNLNMEALKKDVEKLPPKKFQQFMNGLVLLGMAIDETRSLAYTLMPKTLNDYGLEVSLKSLIDKLQKTSIPDIFFYSRFDEDKLDEQMRINIYRIIQEGVGNALRHSKGTKIDVQAVMHDQMLVILIEDNGIGFDASAVMKKNTGIGLQSVKNRVVSLNGRFDIDSMQGRGTSISIEIPLPKRRI